MARVRHLARAPITEALIDLQVEGRPEITYPELRRRFEASDLGYYPKSPILQKSFEVQWVPDEVVPQTRAESNEVGLRLHSQDEKYVAQCRINGVTLSRLPPYVDWKTLRHETRRVWDAYVSRIEPKRVTRIATRYINNLRLPLADGGTYQTYIEKLVDVPNDLPQLVETFFQRFQLVDQASGARVVLTIALGAVPRDGQVPVILDVDAFSQVQLDVSDPRIWTVLEQLHDLKNRCFFGSLTERAVELYE